jgi:tetratricopeptide (TPR) repeat protein
MPQPMSDDTEPKLDPAFVEGVKHFDRGDTEEAAALFGKALRGSSESHRHYSKYLSYYGAALSLNGDAQGLVYCRAAAKKEAQDCDIFYNLARAEIRFQKRAGAVAAIDAGLDADGDHGRLIKLRNAMGVRRPPAISFLSRDHLLNRILGRLTYKKPQAKPSVRR